MRKFLLIDDHAVVRNGVKHMLSEFYEACKVDEAADEEQALEILASEQYDLIFLDINIPKTNTLDLLKRMLANDQKLRVLMFSMNNEKMHAKRYLEAGAKGFLSKDAPIDEIKRVIGIILDNKTYYSDAFIDTLIHEKSGQEINPFDKLSEREFQIATLMLAGKSLTEISATLAIHTSTTGTHKSKIFEKLNVKNLVEMIELAKIHQ
jgi:DNA-binding NarL/FixJ family response regulator